MKICFYAPLKDKEAFHYNQFYAQDVALLQALGVEPVLATTWKEIPWDADLIFVWWWTWAFLPLIKAKLRGRPVVITGVLDLDNPMPGIGYFSRPWHQKLLIWLALRLADRNVFISEFEYGRSKDEFGLKNALYAPLVIDASLHPFSSAPRQPLLFTVAWLEGDNPVRKGVDLAIRAHAKLLDRFPDLEFVVAGAHGSGLDSLKALVESLGTSHRVQFPGRISHEEKVRLLQACGAYLQPSLFEGFGVAAAEAMIAGAPVVACPVGTLPEVLGPDAFFTRERSVEGLVEAVQEALTQASPERLARASQRIQDRYSFSQRVADLHPVLTRLLGKAPKA